MTPTVFHQSWWLNAATNGDFQEVFVRANGQIIGRLPFVLKVRGCWTQCTMPPLTHFLGPAIDDGQGAMCNRLVKRDEITRELLRQLPKTSDFYQKMHSGISDMLAFQEQSYDISVQFTHEILPAPTKVLWSNMRDKTRNVIRRARERLDVREMNDPLEFVAFYNRNLSERGIVNRYDSKTMRHIIAEALRRGQGRMTIAHSLEGKKLAAMFYVWDLRTAYFLLSSRARDAGNGAMSLLIWDAIDECSKRSLVFDFDGVGTSGSILFFTGFGGRVMPRYIARSSSFAYGVSRLVARSLRLRSWQEFG